MIVSPDNPHVSAPYHGSHGRRSGAHDARLNAGDASAAFVAGVHARVLLIVAPLALFLVTVILDVLSMIGMIHITGVIGALLLLVGIAVGVVAAATGIRDWRRLAPQTYARSLGTLHGIGAGVGLGLVLVGAIWRIGVSGGVDIVSLLLEVAGLSILLIGGVLGSEVAMHLPPVDRAALVAPEEVANDAPGVAESRASAPSRRHVPQT